MSRIAIISDLSVFLLVIHMFSTESPFFSLYLPAFCLPFFFTLLILQSFITVLILIFPIISFFCLFQKVRFSCFFPWWVLIMSRRGAALGTRCSWRWSLEVAWWCFGIWWCHLWHPMQCHLVRLKRSAEIIWNPLRWLLFLLFLWFLLFLSLFFLKKTRALVSTESMVDGVNHWG